MSLCFAYYILSCHYAEPCTYIKRNFKVLYDILYAAWCFYDLL